MKKFLIVLIIATMVLSACSAPAAEKGSKSEEPAGPRNLVVSIGTGPVGGNWFPVGAVVATIINENVEGVRAAPTLGGAVANLNQIHSGDLEIGMTNAPTDVDGWEGREPFEKQLREARGMWMLYPEIHHVFALKDTGIKSHEDLKGKNVSPMYLGSTGYVMNQRILDAYGMTTDDFGKTELIGYSGGAELLKDKHLDAYMINTMAPSAPFLDACTFRDVVVFGPSAEVRKALVEKYPDLTELTIKGDTYPGNPQPTETVGYMCGFSCHKDLPEDVIYDIVKAYWENHEQLLSVNPSFAEWIKPENAILGMVLPLHPGAYKYYVEEGYDIPDHLKPID